MQSKNSKFVVLFANLLVVISFFYPASVCPAYEFQSELLPSRLTQSLTKRVLVQNPSPENISPETSAEAASQTVTTEQAQVPEAASQTTTGESAPASETSAQSATVQVESQAPDNSINAQIESLRARAAELGADSNYSDLALQAEQLGDTLVGQSLYADAIRCYQIAYETRKHFVSENDFSLVRPVLGEANCYFHSERLDDSIGWYQHALTIAEQVSGANEEEKVAALEKSLRGLSACYLLQSNGEQALYYSKRAHELAQQKYGAISTDALWAAAELSESLRIGGLLNEAKTFNKEIFDICLLRAAGVQNGTVGGDDGGRSGSPTETEDKTTTSLAGNTISAALLIKPLSDATQFSTTAVSEYNPDEPSQALPIRFWRPATDSIKGAFVCVHGMCLHAGSYDDLALNLMQQGYLVVGIDVRGFGAWKNSRGQDYLNLDSSLSDIHYLVSRIKEMLPEVPVYLVGESMGGAVALRAAALHPELLTGVIASVPAAERFEQKKETIKVALHGILGGIDSYMNIGKSLVKRATQDPYTRQRWQEDPLSRMTLSPRELVKFQTFMTGNDKYVRQITSVPVLVMQGMRDQLVLPQATEKLFCSIPATDKLFLKLEDREHLTLELNQFTPEILNKLLAWTNRHNPGSTQSLEQPNPSEAQTPQGSNEQTPIPETSNIIPEAVPVTDTVVSPAPPAVTTVKQSKPLPSVISKAKSPEVKLVGKQKSKTSKSNSKVIKKFAQRKQQFGKASGSGVRSSKIKAYARQQAAPLLAAA